jgi:hypothetical protein
VNGLQVKALSYLRKYSILEERKNRTQREEKEMKRK